jgi:hypothetical protein
LFTNNVQNIVVYASIIIIDGFLGLNHLPLIDFRPYKVGIIFKEMRIPDGAENQW